MVRGPGHLASRFPRLGRERDSGNGHVMQGHGIQSSYLQEPNAHTYIFISDQQRGQAGTHRVGSSARRETKSAFRQTIFQLSCTGTTLVRGGHRGGGSGGGPACQQQAACRVTGTRSPGKGPPSPMARTRHRDQPKLTCASLQDSSSGSLEQWQPPQVCFNIRASLSPRGLSPGWVGPVGALPLQLPSHLWGDLLPRRALVQRGSSEGAQQPSSLAAGVCSLAGQGRGSDRWQGWAGIPATGSSPAW